MYNRYIPQSDGTYRRNQVPEQKPSAQQRQNPPSPHHIPQEPEPPQQYRQSSSPMDFLKNLLPRDFDTSDLLIVLLLLLMAGDCKENQNTAILTLALYLFL